MDPELGSSPETTQNDRDHNTQPGTMAPVLVRIQTQGSPFSLNLLPAICPSPLWTFPPQPLLCSRGSPLPPVWPNMSPPPLSPQSRFGLRPCVLVPVSRPTELRRGPCLPACPWLVQMIPVSEPCAADQPSRKARQHDSNPKGLLVNSLRPLPSVQEETQTAIINSLPQIHKDTKAKEGKKDAERREKELGNNLFLEYLDELCSDEDFLRRLESTLDIECLDFLFASDRRPLDLSELEEDQMIWQEQSHPGPANTDTAAALGFKEKSSSHFLDLPGTNPNHHRPNTPKKMELQDVWSSCSRSRILERTLTGQVTNTLPGHDPTTSWHTVCQGNSSFMDDSFTSSLHSSPDTSLISDLEEHELLPAVAGSSFFAGSALQDPPGNTTTFLSDRLKQPVQASQNTQNRPPPCEPPAFESPSSSRVSRTFEELPDDSKNDHTNNLTADHLEQRKTERAKEEQSKAQEKSAQVHLEKEEKVCENLQKTQTLNKRQPSQYEEQGQGANIANTGDKLLKTTEKEEHETQKIKVETEKQSENNKSLLPKTSAEKVEEVQKSTIVQRITRSMTAKERVKTTTPMTRIIKSLEITSSPRRGLQDEKLTEEKEAQSWPVSSPTKRSRTDEEESTGNTKGFRAAKSSEKALKRKPKREAAQRKKKQNESEVNH